MEFESNENKSEDCFQDRGFDFNYVVSAREPVDFKPEVKEIHLE